MPHNNSVLSLILLIGLLATITTTYNIAFAQDEDEKEEEEKEQEEEETKDEESEEQKEEEDSDTKEEEETEEQQTEQNESNTEEETPITTTNLTGNQILDLLQPVVNPVEEISTTVAEPIIEKKEFNATCKCMTTGAATDKPKPPTPQPNNPNQAIPLTKADIQDSKSFGEVVDPAYTGFYTVPNLLDAIINDVSFWSQAGKSSFYIKLDNALDSYQVCSMELNVYQPKNTPFLLDVGVSQNYTGVLDQPTEQIKFDKCVKNMDEIYMIFDNPSGSYVSISEIKLFGSKLTGTATTPTTQPPTIIAPPILEPKIPTENATKINIQDSTAEIDIKNSTVTFKFDPLTGIFKGAM